MFKELDVLLKPAVLHRVRGVLVELGLHMSARQSLFRLLRLTPHILWLPLQCLAEVQAFQIACSKPKSATRETFVSK